MYTYTPLTPPVLNMREAAVQEGKRASLHPPSPHCGSHRPQYGARLLRSLS